MYIFGQSAEGVTKKRGCYATFTLPGDEGFGAYLELPTGTIPPYSGVSTGEGTSATHAPIIVTGITFAQKEKFQLVQCFNDHAYTYAFGHDPMSSLIEVSFLGFLTSDDGTGWSNVIQSFCYEYKRARLIESKQMAKIYVASDKPLQGFVVGMRSGTASAEYNFQNFSVTLLAVAAHEGVATWS
jgi:hypothetical protein